MGCMVLPGIYGLLVQGVLFVCVVCTLVLKKLKEQHGGSRRSWTVFFMDSSKQIFGSGWIHVLNLTFAKYLEGKSHNGDECEWYWINIMIDCTLGVVINYVLLRSLLRLVHFLAPHCSPDFAPGDYYTVDQDDVKKFNRRRYLLQLAMWLMVVTGMKVCILVTMLTFSDLLLAVAHFVLAWVEDNPDAELWVVMILTPVVMNALQFWFVDNFIKKREDKSSTSSRRDSVEGDADLIVGAPVDAENLSPRPLAPMLPCT